MSKRVKKAKLEKKGWVSSFTLIGEAKVGDYTYKIDQKSDSSDWVYNSVNLGVNCGENGTVYADLMGGYGEDRDNVVFVHGKKEDNSDDFSNRFEIDWDDRFDSDILETIGDLCFITIGIEKDKNNKTFTKRFLSPYDAIQYLEEHLEDGMIVNVKGSLKYQLYKGEVSVKKEIKSIFLSKVDSADKYSARFTQTMLLKSNSVGRLNKERGVIPITGTILEYSKKWGDKEVRQIVPLNKIFEYEVDTNNANTPKILDALFGVKRDISQCTYEGDLIEAGAAVAATYDDLPSEIQFLVDENILTLDEALASCTEGKETERRMVIRKPSIKLVGEEGDKIPVIQKFEKRYKEQDLFLDFMYEDEDEEDEDEDTDVPFDIEDNESDDDQDWLKTL